MNWKAFSEKLHLISGKHTQSTAAAIIMQLTTNKASRRHKVCNKKLSITWTSEFGGCDVGKYRFSSSSSSSQTRHCPPPTPASEYFIYETSSEIIPCLSRSSHEPSFYINHYSPRRALSASFNSEMSFFMLHESACACFGLDEWKHLRHLNK